MEFDKSKVYTTFNADEVKIGSKGYFANRKEDLITRVEIEIDDYCTLDKISSPSPTSDYVFITDGCTYRYFYLVEEPKEKTKRPCTREELLGKLKEQGLPMLKTTVGNLLFTVADMSDNNVYIGSENQSYEGLCKCYTLLDGSELWVEE